MQLTLLPTCNKHGCHVTSHKCQEICKHFMDSHIAGRDILCFHALTPRYLAPVFILLRCRKKIQDKQRKIKESGRRLIVKGPLLEAEGSHKRTETQAKQNGFLCSVLFALLSCIFVVGVTWKNIFFCYDHCGRNCLNWLRGPCTRALCRGKCALLRAPCTQKAGNCCIVVEKFLSWVRGQGFCPVWQKIFLHCDYCDKRFCLCHNRRGYFFCAAPLIQHYNANGRYVFVLRLGLQFDQPG